ncbi:hypothetical protein FB45DRAFT_1113950 [Roridomyces roridus]|uniref:Uncharacterized protein n=1 Tax=Roridomyces roridus TaxID=1738132 RepID=A0AAD7CAB6_9AGAR|nr:hypothetical protein FB45DRAFT_1113950 [Roridomyces roridus]
MLIYPVSLGVITSLYAATSSEAALEMDGEIIDEILSLPLLGALTVQLYFYLQAFPKDRSFVKGLVCAICCVILFDEIVDLDSYFDTFGPGFADISSLLKIRLTWIVGPLAAGLLGLASQTFYAHRIYILSGNRVLSSLVLVISLTSTTACVTLSVWISQVYSRCEVAEPPSLEK